MKVSTRITHGCIILAMMAFVCISGCDQKVTFQRADTQKIGKYTVILWLPARKLNATRTPFQLSILDATQKPVKNAMIVVRYSLPPVPGANVPDLSVVPQYRANRWDATLNFTMPGMWIVTAYIKIKKQEKRISFNVLVR